MILPLDKLPFGIMIKWFPGPTILVVKISISLKNEKDDHQGWNSEKTSFELLDQQKYKNCVGPLEVN